MNDSNWPGPYPAIEAEDFTGGFTIGKALIIGDGELTPGRNVDAIDVGAGVAEAKLIGYTEPEMIMLVAYCLGRWAKGEEKLAERTALGMGIDLTSWYRILAAALSNGG